MDFEVSHVDQNGKLHIPRHIRDAAGIALGDALVIIRDGKCLRVMAPQAAIEHARPTEGHGSSSEMGVE